MAQLPARTTESDAMSRDLVKRGFKFVCSTICYALMQATGMVNDHLISCPRHRELRPGRRGEVKIAGCLYLVVISSEYASPARTETSLAISALKFRDSSTALGMTKRGLTRDEPQL